MTIETCLPHCSSAIVVVGGDPELQRVQVADVHAVVEPEHVGLKFVDQLDIALDPVDQELLAGFVAAVGDIVEISPLRDRTGPPAWL